MQYIMETTMSKILKVSIVLGLMIGVTFKSSWQTLNGKLILSISLSLKCITKSKRLKFEKLLMGKAHWSFGKLGCRNITSMYQGEQKLLLNGTNENQQSIIFQIFEWHQIGRHEEKFQT